MKKTLETDLLLSSYLYNLPQDLIASRPSPKRHDSKLLVYFAERDEIIHSSFYHLAQFLPSQSTLVRNQTKVFPCRLKGAKKTGGAVEIFVLSLARDDRGLLTVLIKSARRKKQGEYYQLPGGAVAQLKEILEDGRFKISLDLGGDLNAYLERFGKIPIPPYIRGGESDGQDKVDYQTVYAEQMGSVAAPTAGLHFSDEVFASLREANIDIASVTLHVGMGTFAPVKSTRINDHKMHAEKYFVSAENLQKMRSASKTIAVGTTSLRVLEDSYHQNIVPGKVYTTDIFLHPGKEIESIDGLITNFHLPGSSLLMLVSCLIGRVKTLELYGEAIKHNYRFFSYGDAMLIMR